ncbi:hypothetical protein BGX31_009095, partial [Mortierella sp. GBA43]
LNSMPLNVIPPIITVESLYLKAYVTQGCACADIRFYKGTIIDSGKYHTPLVERVSGDSSASRSSLVSTLPYVNENQTFTSKSYLQEPNKTNNKDDSPY